MLELREDDLSSALVRALLAIHLSGMHESSPPGHVFALDLSGLQTPDVTVWTAWDSDACAGIGALKLLGDGTGELKSMRTHPDHLRRGVARALLEHIERIRDNLMEVFARAAKEERPTGEVADAIAEERFKR